jgi:MFS family permease
MSFISATTVLPSFVAMLTNSEVLIGLSSSLMSGGWLLPQLFIASAVARLPHKRPLMVRAAWISRPLLLMLALIIWLFGKTAPTFTLVVTLIGVFIFSAGDAMVGLPWLDLMARTIPQRRRGRTMGISQIVGGLGGVGAGMIVRRVLSKESPWGFPANYALLFATCGIFLLISAIAVTSIREPDSPSLTKQVPSMQKVLASLPRILLSDRPFLRLVLTRLLVGFVGLATAFYVLHATRNLGFGVEAVGLFVSVQVIVLVIAGLMTGVIQDRWGPLAHIRAAIGLSILPPLLALGAAPLLGVLGKGVLYYYLLVYLFLGIYVGASSWPFFTWIMEHAPEAQRPLYIGLINTLSAIVMFASALGGVIVNAFSFQAAFVTAAFVAIAAYALSLSLPDTRRRMPADMQ